ncbi:hypothetical protein [uncultured Arcticibacterium sp.]|uniref:hypothetical protein n=1 Tax=uncultured Arcticibacterium sp. TaxID=2173042 RepID=UPI0030F8451C
MKKLLLALCLFSFTLTTALAQDSNLKVEVKDGPKPDIYIDGKKYDHDILDLLDQNKIESVNVVKGKKALDEYNAPNGVIFIKTKNTNPDHEVKIRVKDSKDVKLSFDKADPMIIIDGKKVDKATLKKVDPDNIASIDVLKDKAASDKYNAPNGVIIVKTKSGNKKK